MQIPNGARASTVSCLADDGHSSELISGDWAKGTAPAAYHPVHVDAMEQPPVNGHTPEVEMERHGMSHPRCCSICVMLDCCRDGQPLMQVRVVLLFVLV